VVGLLLKDSNRPYGNYIFHTAVGTVILPWLGRQSPIDGNRMRYSYSDTYTARCEFSIIETTNVWKQHKWNSLVHFWGLRSWTYIRQRYSYPFNVPWRPIGLWDVKDPTFSRQSAHRWRWGCQPYAPATL
jgi:hypothetical protein